jgi:tetratricopeptide (TPR) repeat protein
LNVTSPAAYNEANDVARAKVAATNVAMKAESFTMQFANITNNSIELHLRWENVMVSLPITTDVDAKVMAQINAAMTVDSRPYFAAAQYYYDNGKDLKMAKEWADKAVASNPNAYWMTLLNARICAKMGDKAGAKAMAQKTVEMATAGKNDDYVKMANDLLKTL